MLVKGLISHRSPPPPLPEKHSKVIMNGWLVRSQANTIELLLVYYNIDRLQLLQSCFNNKKIFGKDST